MRDLKPCPFCGGETKVFREKLPICHEYRVKCLNENCKVFMPYSLNRDTAIKVWNTRTQPPADSELVKALEDMLCVFETTMTCDEPVIKNANQALSNHKKGGGE